MFILFTFKKILMIITSYAVASRITDDSRMHASNALAGVTYYGNVRPSNWKKSYDSNGNKSLFGFDSVTEKWIRLE